LREHRQHDRVAQPLEDQRVELVLADRGDVEEVGVDRGNDQPNADERDNRRANPPSPVSLSDGTDLCGYLGDYTPPLSAAVLRAPPVTFHLARIWSYLPDAITALSAP